MDRFTTNKDVSEMGMYELAHNGCYIKDGKARYRDFENDTDARDLARNLIKTFTNEEVYFDDDNFDDEMLELLIDGTSTMEGLIALFYRNLWAMADLRERLKEYEDAEEQGLLLRLHCKVGDTVYEINPLTNKVTERIIKSIVICNAPDLTIMYKSGYDYSIISDDFGKTVFLKREEAEQKLKEMESE